MARISKVGTGWSAEEQATDWYLDIQTWLATEGSVDYGSRIEAVCKGHVGTNDVTTSTATVHGWYAYADPSVAWKPDGTNDSVAPTGDRIYIATPNGRLSGFKFSTSNSFGSGFRFTSTAINCSLEDSMVEQLSVSAGSGGEALRLNTSSNPAEAPLILRCYIRHLAENTTPGFLQQTNGGHAVMKSCVIYSASNRYGYGSSAGTFIIYDSYAFGPGPTGDGFPTTSTTLLNTASQDASGSPGLTLVDPAALQSYLTGDVRTVAGGPLDIAGTEAPFLGISLGEAASNSIFVQEFSAGYKVFQRPEIATALSIPITVSTTGDPSGGLEYRIINHDTLGEIQAWAVLSASSTPGVEVLPISVPTTLGLSKLRIEVRFIADTAVTYQTTVPFSIGVVYIQYGQSNGLRRLTRTSSTLTPSTYAAHFTSGDWTDVAMTGDGAISTVNNLISALGVPVAYLNYSVDSQSIDALTEGTHYNTLASAVLAATGNSWELLGLDQGEQDAKLGTNATQYFNTCTTLRNKLSGINDRAFTILVNYGGNSNGYDVAYTDESIEEVRAGKRQFVANYSNVIWGGHRLDLALADSIHNTAEAYAIASEREISAYLYHIGITTTPAIRTIQSVVLDGLNAQVTYTPGSAPITIAGASTATTVVDDQSTQYTITNSIATGPDTIVHTLNSTPSGLITVTDWYGAEPVLSSYPDYVFPSSGSSQEAVSNLSVMVSGIPDGTYLINLYYRGQPADNVFSSTVSVAGENIAANNLPVPVGTALAGWVLSVDNTQGAVLFGVTA